VTRRSTQVFPWRAQRATFAPSIVLFITTQGRSRASTPLGKTAGAQARRGPSTCELGHQNFMRRVVHERLGTTPDEMPGGHLAMLSRPKELAERLLSYL